MFWHTSQKRQKAKPWALNAPNGHKKGDSIFSKPLTRQQTDPAAKEGVN